MLPQRILDQFARIPHNTTIENKYYGVFDKILNKVCFTDDTFTIEPQYVLPQAVGVPTIDFVVTYVVEVNDLPIFFLEIKPPLHLDHISSRVDADAQMRSRFRALYNVTPTPRFHGVSVMGQRLAFYCMDKATGHVNPNYVAPSNDYMIDTVPEDRWETDITTEEGYQRFMTVINDVKQMAAAL
ncbi:hypothetical protein M378DRAFT_157840 [Amanita muscaria Koide BX008]|uniref:Uncharacterized protein n=1 Tax=Amanita muscaria (strain Koide BX008) TaxID=946122 RepID=A0A0C2SYW8_AMAMK|nr:hypothetical protein M378DRAFT_157840 [Amanita muscaria Koide BX008]